MLRTIRAGNTNKPNPFTILIIATPAFRRPTGVQKVIADPIMQDSQAFANTAKYVSDVLFGLLPGQAERALGDPDIEPHVRVLAHYDPSLPVDDEHAFVELHPSSHNVEPRSREIAKFTRSLPISGEIDVMFAITSNESHQTATAFAMDDDSRGGGTKFTIDGQTFEHAHFALIPGTVALPASADALVALHEFQHAVSSYQNGFIADLHADGAPAVNRKVRGNPGGPIPADFGEYDGVRFASATRRGPLNYEPNWTSFHCELHDPTQPAIMDDTQYGTPPVSCQNDKITRMFVRDRILAKINRM